MVKTLKMMIMAVLMLLPVCASAQNAGLQKMASILKKTSTITADVVRTRHREAVTKDAVAKGKFTYKNSSKMNIVFSADDKLIMEGKTFTMVRDGKKRVADVGGKSPMEPMLNMLSCIVSGTELKNAKVEDNGSVVTITPQTANGKKQKRQMYQSFVLTIDGKNHLLKSIRLNEKGANYTQFDFSNVIQK